MMRIASLSIFIFYVITQPAFAEVLFQDSFETGDLTHADTVTGARWTGSQNSYPDSVSVSTDRSHSGNHSLRFHFSGNRDLNDDAWAEQRFNLGQSQTDFHLRYYIYFPSNYKIRDVPGQSDNTKMFYLWGDSYAASPSIVGMQMEANMNVYFSPRISGYPHVIDCTGNSGNLGSLGSWTLTSEFLGKWACFEFHFKLDDGSTNGMLQMWVDGNLVIDGQNLGWHRSNCLPWYWLNGYLMGWSNSGFDEDTDVYIDDVVFATEYIGLGPSRPQGLLIKGIGP